MKYCSNCGEPLDNNGLCQNCQIEYAVEIRENKEQDDLTLGIVSMVFAGLGIGPLIFIGSIVGLITGIITIKRKGKFKFMGVIAVSVAAGAAAFWLIYLAIIISMIQYI